MLSDKPNLIYVFADQLRYDALGFNGNENAITPELDALSEECLCLDNAVSGHPVCAPYRASLFTGKYTTSTGMVINELRINPEHETIAEVFNASGYETCYIGKWHLYANQLGHHYDVKNSFIPEGPDRLGFNDCFAAYNFHHEYYAPKAYYHLNSSEKLEAEGYEPDFMTDYAITQLKRLKEGEKPFALFLSLGTPHDPWTKENVPAEYYELFKNTAFSLPKNYSPRNDRHADMWARLKPSERRQLTEWMRVYSAMTANLSFNLGRLAAFLKESGLWESSLFVFTSDHGEMFGAQGRRAKNIFYEEAIKVPFLMHFADRLPAGRGKFVLNTVDIMPSLLSLMGLPVPESVQGKDLSLCMLKGDSCPSGEGEALLMGTGPTAIYGNGREWRGIRTAGWLYAVYRSDGEEHLYNLEEDPLEMHNLAGEAAFSRKKEELKVLMHSKMEEIGDEFLTCRQFKRKHIKNRIIQKI